MPDFCGTCKAPIVWAMTPTGAKAPIDVHPDPKANVLLIQHSDYGLLAITLSGDALDRARAGSAPLRTNHWMTCPDREDWRAKQDAKKAARGERATTTATRSRR